MRSVPVPAISAGDVLVSRSSARADLYEISVVPALASMKCTRYGEGMDAGRQLACRLGVGAWFTCDHTHFLHLDGQRFVQEAYMPDDRTPPESNRATAEKGREEAEDLREEADRGRDTAEEHRVAAESARKGAEQFRVLAEEARVFREQSREELERIREEREALRQAAEAARQAAEEARHATVAAVAATADALSANLAQMQFLEEARTTLMTLGLTKPGKPQ